MAEARARRHRRSRPQTRRRLTKWAPRVAPPIRSHRTPPPCGDPPKRRSSFTCPAKTCRTGRSQETLSARVVVTASPGGRHRTTAPCATRPMHGPTLPRRGPAGRQPCRRHERNRTSLRSETHLHRQSMRPTIRRAWLVRRLAPGGERRSLAHHCAERSVATIRHVPDAL